MNFKVLVLFSLSSFVLGAPKLVLPNFKFLPDGRIVGGKDAKIIDYPFQVSVEWHGRHICGGSILDENHIITAAHCTDGSSANDFTIRGGSDIVGSGGQVRKVLDINQNPNFNFWTIDFDVSIVKLSEPFKLVDEVVAINLPDSELSEGTLVNITGWGAIEEGGWLSEQLQVVEVPIVGRDSCKKAYSNHEITDNMICAGLAEGGAEGGKDSCQGDSGGPLSHNQVLYGIVSWGYGCAEPGHPGVYSNVASLRQFIDSVLT